MAYVRGAGLAGRQGTPDSKHKKAQAAQHLNLLLPPIQNVQEMHVRQVGAPTDKGRSELGPA